MIPNNRTTTGECESCANVTDLKMSQYGNIMMCGSCLSDEAKAIEESRKVINQARAQDAQLEVKQDLFNAGTTAFATMQAAIEHNPEIPTDQKTVALLTEISARIDILNKAIFEKEADLNEDKNARKALTVNAQNLFAQLESREREKQREKFKQFDTTYKAGPVRKPTPVTKPSQGNSALKEVKAAAAKYDVPWNTLKMMVDALKKPVEEVAKHYAKQLGKIQ